jgi:hypothetical protein
MKILISTVLVMCWWTTTALGQSTGKISTTQTSSKEIIMDQFLRQGLIPISPKKPGAESYKKFREIMISLNQWMGPYQRVERKDNNYFAVFKDGSIPIVASFKSDNKITSFYFSGCPMGQKLSLSKAPSSFKPLLSQCPNLKP